MGSQRCRRAGRAAAVLVALLSLGVAAGCQSGAPGGSSATPSRQSKYAFAGCVTTKEGEPFTAKVEGGGSVRGAVLGSGERAAVLSHELNTTPCAWLGVARELAADGYQVALWGYGDLTGFDRVKELAAVVAEVRDNGAEKVVLAGGSIGGCLTLIGASRITPPVAGIAVLSCAGQYDPVDRIPTKPEAAKVTVPTLYLVAEDDEFLAELSAEEFAGIKAKDKQRVVLPGSAAHGVAIFEDPKHGTKAKKTFLEFVDRVTG